MRTADPHCLSCPKLPTQIASVVLLNQYGIQPCAPMMPCPCGSHVDSIPSPPVGSYAPTRLWGFGHGWNDMMIDTQGAWTMKYRYEGATAHPVSSRVNVGVVAGSGRTLQRVWYP